ncbi:unnamed protein product [Oreochromis niloticus]|nr:unnamed protein product [Mustela putorius furo]
MSAVITSLCSILMFVGVFVLVSADQKTITAESGQDVTLTCRAPNNNIRAVEWSRADLGDEYVLLYRDRQFFPDNQHPSFKNRVDLQDRQMKDGDVSLILKDVTINDAGTYECRVVQEIGKPMKLISNIHLHVVPPGRSGPVPFWHRKDGFYELTIGLGVALSLCFFIAVVGFCTYICRLSRGEHPVNRNTKRLRQTRQQNYEMDDLRTDFRRQTSRI